MTVVRSLDDELLLCMVRNTEGAGAAVILGQIAVLLTLGYDIIVQGQEALCIGRIAESLFLGSGASRRCGDHACCKCIGSHRCRLDTGYYSLAFFQKYCSLSTR